MKIIYKTWIYTCLFTILCLAGCTSETPASPGQNGGEQTSGTDDSENTEENTDNTETVNETGVLILGKSLNNPENGALTYIAPDGTIEEDVWQKANGSMLIGDLHDLFICQNKLYILCGTDSNQQGIDGGLVIADATTFKKEKSFSLSEISFEKPEGTGPEYRPFLKTPSCLAVLDEKNVFIKDAQGLFRFDTTTGKLTAVEGTYHIANTISGNGNLEAKVTSKGLVVADGKLYIGSAGFWGDQSGVFEIIANTDKVNRVLEVPVDLVSGLTKGNENELLLAYYTRGTKRSNKICRIDLTTFQTAETIAKPTAISLAPGFFDKCGVAYDGNNYLYLSEIEETETKVNYKMTLNRVSLTDGTSETLADFTEEFPDAKFLTTNPVMDVNNQWVYVSVADNMYEGQPSVNHILVYDCSGEVPVLKQNISGHTSRVSGIYFTSNYN